MGPGTAPALSGPTRRALASSTLDIDPPPAPTLWISITGTPTGQLATEASLGTRISPSQTATSVDFPPLSKDRMFETPAGRASPQVPTPPAAGPLSMVLTGSRAAIRAETAPPLDCIIRSLAFREAARSLRSRTPRYR